MFIFPNKNRINASTKTFMNKPGIKRFITYEIVLKHLQLIPLHFLLDFHLIFKPCHREYRLAWCSMESKPYLDMNKQMSFVFKGDFCLHAVSFEKTLLSHRRADREIQAMQQDISHESNSSQN